MTGIYEKLRKMILLIMTSAMSFLFLFCPVQAENSTLASEGIDPGQPGTITVNRAWDSAWPVTGTVIHLYKVADLKGDMTFSYTEKFAQEAENISLPVATQTENSTWEDSRNALKKLVDEKDIQPDDTIIWPNRSSNVTFRNLKNGLYLVTGEEITYNGKKYVSSGNLIPLPRRDSNLKPWEYDIPIEMKHTEETVKIPATPVPSATPSPSVKKTPAPSEKPNTGDNFHFWIYTGVLIAMGAVIGVVIYIRTKERKD